MKGITSSNLFLQQKISYQKMGTDGKREILGAIRKKSLLNSVSKKEPQYLKYQDVKKKYCS
jgi:hypothetical protein